ncbi:unnamed protein product [Larinioides sclopetarius]|uniref:Uncharacterized protein n=1 Tax=Larinioides sclopetarius TaxID=280406 RepID=A0AAV2BNB4_9ARAC
MIYTQEEKLVLRKLELLMQLANGNMLFMAKWKEICNLKDIVKEHLNEELFNLGFNANENSSGAEAVLEYLKVLNGRFFDDLRTCLNNYCSDVEWLTANVRKCDAFHKHIWWKILNDANHYQQLLRTLFIRYMKTYDMIETAIVSIS